MMNAESQVCCNVMLDKETDDFDMFFVHLDSSDDWEVQDKNDLKSFLGNVFS